MILNSPGDPASASYMALAAVDELIELLVSRKIISESDCTLLVGSIVNRLSQANNHDSKRAASFLAGRAD